MSNGAEWFRYYAGWCTKISGDAFDVKPAGIGMDTGVDMHTYTLKEPYSVVGLIFPWNGPIFNVCAKLAPSLAAGCSSIVKPAEETPLSAMVLNRLMQRPGCPTESSTWSPAMATPRAQPSPRIRTSRRSLHRVDGNR